jgi:hypothetical protein
VFASPPAVRFRQVGVSFSHFIVQCFAVIGGAVATLGIVNMVLKSSLKNLGGVISPRNANVRR